MSTLMGSDSVAGGTISMQDYPDQRELVTVRSTNLTAVAHRLTNAQRIAREAVASFTDYVRDPARFRRIEGKLIQALAAAEARQTR